ncbi:MAG TPA: hypothetical protein VN879_07980 [Candidatus Acidoferrales bacterium]|jgi:hypothetical protein|nr:hypothetical protein [Candidatus Acidoferrales bacterium]
MVGNQRHSLPRLIDKLIEPTLGQHAEKTRTKYLLEFPAGSTGTLEA